MNTKTLTITNFAGTLTRYNDGDIDSGLAKYNTSNSYDPFSTPGNLTWFEQPVRIDSGGTVITDAIVAMKERVESGILYVYAIGHLGRLYKIQVNDPTTFNPNYDNPVLLATLSSNSPTFTRGGSMEFFGSTERIYIGHDVGVTRINFDGTSETFVGAAGSYTQNVPRPMEQFIGKLYVGNGSNLAEIDSTATVTSYTKFSPGFPDNTQVRDLDTSPDGTYLQVVVSRLALSDITATTPDTQSMASSESYIFKWNGTDSGYTAFDTFPSLSLGANVSFGQRQFTFGTDIAGSSVFNPTNKILSPNLSQVPLPNAASSNGNIVGWTTPEFSGGVLKATQFIYGPLDKEYKEDSWYRQFQMSASSPETDIVRCPAAFITSTFNIGVVSSGYAGGVFGVAKLYFSTIETSAGPTTDYKLYKFYLVSTGSGTPIAGVYETQTQLFSKKVLPKEVRLYTEPLVSGNVFTVALIGSDGNAISGSSQTFTVGSNVTAGQDYVWYTPQTAPTYAIGLRITNSSTVNWVLTKAEIDYVDGGK